MSTHERKEPEDQEPCRSLTDEEIVTERTLSRRSFVAATGLFLTGGAMALLTNRSALAQQTDPNKPADPDKRPADPDKQPADPDGKKHHRHHHHHHHHHAPPPTDPNAPPPPPPHPDSNR